MMLVLLALAVSVRTLEGAFEDELVSLDGNTASFATRELPKRSLLSLDWPERERDPGGPRVIELEGGYVLNCGLAGLEGERLSTTGPFSVPLKHVAAVVFSGASPTAERSIRDVLLLATGDELKGTLVRMDAKNLEFESKLGRREYRFGELRALLTSSRLSRPPGGEIAVELTDGSILPFESLEISEAVRGVALGSRVSLQSRSVARVRFRPAGTVELGGWEEARYEPTYEVERGLFPPRRDRNVLGRPLRMRGRTYLRGVGVRPPAVIRWKLPEGARLLRGLCGLDDAARGRGRATVRFIADGTQAWAGKLVGRRMLDIKARLGGAAVLELVVEEGPDGTDAADYVNVVEMLAVREKEG